MPRLTPTESKLLNDTIFERMTRKLTPSEEKAEQAAVRAVNDFTLQKILEAKEVKSKYDFLLPMLVEDMAARGAISPNVLAAARKHIKRQKKLKGRDDNV